MRPPDTARCDKGSARLVTALLLGALLIQLPGCAPGEQQPPNILLIIADDLGMADLGAYGSEIRTPELDKLAYQGLRFTQFRASPSCSPSRAMLFTGVDSHRAGLGNMAEELSPNQRGKPGYEGHINERVVTVAELLRDAGYRTYLTGKWHLGLDEANSPAARGFDRSFSMLTGGAHHFDDPKPAYAPNPEDKAPFREDGQKITKLPPNYRYSSQFFVDQLIHYLEADRDREQKPFFAVLSFMAPHWPLQAPSEAIQGYHGHYDAGYEALASVRLARQKALGIVDEAHPLVPLPHKAASWEQLSPEEQKTQTRSMEIYAAMITEIDTHSGRLFDYLRKRQILDNTFIVFLSDNGAEGHDLDQTWPADKFPRIRKVVEQRHDFSYERMGHKNSYVLYGPGWARASAPGFRLHKAFVSEGGIRVPLFIRYPKTIPTGDINREQFHIIDIAPTLLGLAGAKTPADNQYNGRPVETMTGIDMLPYIQSHSTTRVPPKRIEVFEVLAKRYVLDYPWKITHQPPPYGKGRWALYHLEDDPTETRDLAAEYPERVLQLEQHWQAYARRNRVILPDWLSGY